MSHAECHVVEWDLPGDVLDSILAPLPVKSITRCASVAKSWKDVIATRPALQERVARENAWRSKDVQSTVFNLAKVFDNSSTEEGDWSIECAAMCGTKLAVSDGRLGVRVFDVGSRRTVLAIMSADVRVLSFVGEGFLFGSRGSVLLGWDLSIGGETFFETTLSTERHERITAITALDAHIAVGGASGLIKTWRIGVWSAQGQLSEGHTTQIESLVPAEEGAVLLSLSEDMTIRIWDVFQSQCLNVFASSVGFVKSFCVLEYANTKAIAVVQSNSITLARLYTWEILGAAVEEHQGAIAFLKSYGSWVVSATTNGLIRVWATEDGHLECARALQAPCSSHAHDRLLDVWIADDHLVSVSTFGKLMVWDFSSKDEG